MNRTVLAVLAVFLVAAAGGAGLYVLTGEQTPATNSTGTATPTTATPTTPVPTTTATPTPTPSENESESRPSPSNNTSDHPDQPKYVAMLSRILRSNSTQMTSLDTPLPENNTLHSGMVEIKSIEIEEYGFGTENDTRLRVEYYNTNHEGDGINEVRVISLVYSHVINESIANNDTVSFDEIDVISYQNRSSTEPSARLKIDEAWATYYATGHWDGFESVGTFTGTTEIYQSGGFGRQPVEFRQRIERNTSENISILRVEEYGNILFVDYSTKVGVENTDRRLAQLYRIVKIFGDGINNNEFSSKTDLYKGKSGVADIFIEERYLRNDGTYDIRTWTINNATDASEVATGEKSFNETFQMLREDDMVQENDVIGK